MYVVCTAVMLGVTLLTDVCCLYCCDVGCSVTDLCMLVACTAVMLGVEFLTDVCCLYSCHADVTIMTDGC